jgi:hypothetical protein
MPDDNPLDDNPLGAIVGDVAAFQSHRPERPTLYSQPPITVNDLFNLGACAELIEQRALRSPAVQMARAGSRRNAKLHTWAPVDPSLGVSDEVRPSAVNQELATGSTLILNGLQRYWTPIRNFCAALARDLGTPVNANAYLTPAAAEAIAVLVREGVADRLTSADDIDVR